ncbi:hypothetical protein HNQ60_004508 [Povalibacter uvarum]|uniref:Uncharacterized protein n=1 Tax=Povalibacter uvarum TaxID=732238 RepID=A0A841HQW9_9GAMM|nr:hypothetical protein [Povalibacter uvarum]MBB6095617.1 hypothetical protein [Povalibacter uvarum]
MREDMYKVIVERPRRGQSGYNAAARRRNDFDGPASLGMRAGYGYRGLNENLAPLRRYLRAQVGRPWNKVFSEICAGIDGRNTVQQHIRQHIDDFIATKVGLRDGKLIDLAQRYRFWPDDGALHQELYVDPRSGLIRINKWYRAWRRERLEDVKRALADIATRRRTIDKDTQLHLLERIWFQVTTSVVPPARTREVVVKGRRVTHTIRDKRYDAILRREVWQDDGVEDERERVYGVRNRYGVSKRQLSKRELVAYGLR